MKYIKYRIHFHTEEGDVFFDKTMTHTSKNEEIAKKEAFNGEYTIEDDGQPEPVVPVNEDVSWDTMAEAIKEGVNEV